MREQTTSARPLQSVGLKRKFTALSSMSARATEENHVVRPCTHRAFTDDRGPDLSNQIFDACFWDEWSDGLQHEPGLQQRTCRLLRLLIFAVFTTCSGPRGDVPGWPSHTRASVTVDGTLELL